MNRSYRSRRNVSGGRSAGRASGYRRRSGPGGLSLNIILLAASIIAGLVSWIIGNFVYEVFFNQIPRVFLIGIVFAILCLCVLVVVHGVGRLTGAFEEPVLPLPDIPGMIPVLIAAGTAAVFFLSALFQWIYAMDFQKQVQNPTSYIFVMDDSGSTAESDPAQMRYSAIDDVLEDMDESFPYMVYSFSDNYEILRGMAPISEGKDGLTGNSYGGTAIRGVLTQVINDYKNQVWDGGERPKVILMTDGYATDIGLFHPINRVLKQYVREGISISAVGLEQTDENLMNQIADTTGGVFVRASDAGDLSSAMQSAVSLTSSRDLVSARYIDHADVLLGFLRILFIFILGTGTGLLAMLVYGNEDSTILMIVSSAAKALAGALVMEIGTGVFGMPVKLAWLILWILLAATIALKPFGDRYVRTRTAGLDMLGN